MTFTEVLKQKNELKKLRLHQKEYKINVLSNITVNQISPYLEVALLQKAINASVSIGNYDNIVQDIQSAEEFDTVIIFWELANLIDGFQYKSLTMDRSQIESLIAKTKSEIDLVLEAGKKCRMLLINKFSAAIFPLNYFSEGVFETVCKELNSYLEEKAKSFFLVDIEKIFLKLSIEKSIDLRNYYSSKALYTTHFFSSYVDLIMPVILSNNGILKKAIVLDCDNTLWKGIVGEDGLQGIQMSSNTSAGVPFAEVQTIIKYLAKRGVIICLNSKNNQRDVDEVFEKHPDMILKEEDIVLKMVNWDDKVTNLKTIAKKINIGIDSLLFIDDSDFEVEMVRKFLPEVEVLQVPKSTNEYPKALRDKIGQLFLNNATSDDSKRIDSYKANIQRENEASQYDNIDQYLESLQLNVSIHIGKSEYIARMAQLTQKTNQFNLTTKRYTEPEIQVMLEDKNFDIFLFQVSDKYGDFGHTAQVIVQYQDETANIDTFLMSCRIIGRNIEYCIVEFVLDFLKKKGIKNVEAQYFKTIKNQQVREFFEKADFVCVYDIEQEKKYIRDLSNYEKKSFNYIKINYEREN